MENEQFYTTSQAADKLGISRIAVYKKIKSGKLKATRCGRVFMIPADEFGYKRLTPAQAVVIEQGVERAVKEYGQVLKMLGQE